MRKPFIFFIFSCFLFLTSCSKENQEKTTEIRSDLKNIEYLTINILDDYYKRGLSMLELEHKYSPNEKFILHRSMDENPLVKQIVAKSSSRKDFEKNVNDYFESEISVNISNEEYQELVILACSKAIVLYNYPKDILSNRQNCAAGIIGGVITGGLTGCRVGASVGSWFASPVKGCIVGSILGVIGGAYGGGIIGGCFD